MSKLEPHKAFTLLDYAMDRLLATERVEQAFLAGMRSATSRSMSTPYY